jgi:hypothetical protein
MFHFHLSFLILAIDTLVIFHLVMGYFISSNRKIGRLFYGCLGDLRLVLLISFCWLC